VPDSTEGALQPVNTALTWAKRAGGQLLLHRAALSSKNTFRFCRKIPGDVHLSPSKMTLHDYYITRSRRSFMKITEQEGP